MGVDETETDPSVPSEAYKRGTDVDCYDEEGEANASSLQKSASADAFCGKLVYHEGTSLEQVSPPDQDFPSDKISKFDVQISNYAGTALEDFCQPYCGPGGDQAWYAVHTAGSEAGLTHPPGEADSQENSDRDQIYYAAVNLPNAGHVAQEHTGAWEMNGFYSNVPYQAFVGFLYDAQGDPVDEAQLAQLIEAENLGSSAIAKVCGFSPEIDFAATAAIGSCEITLHYRGPSDSDDFRDGYSYECKSPTYTCGALSGAAWYGRIQCPWPCGPDSETDYRAWHWVAAPSLDRECRAREPGFAFDALQDAEGPYLAHDLDVYSPTASVVEQGRSVPSTYSWATDVAGDAQDPVDDALDTLPGVPDTSEATAVATKDHRVEPNAQPPAGLADTSQSLADDPDLQRSIDDCEALQSTETPETADPWVDLVDGRTKVGSNSQRSGTGQEAQVPFYEGRGLGPGPALDTVGFTEGLVGADNTGEDAGLYLNAAEGQDSSNRRGPATVWTQGQVGMFTDKDDDGEYDQAFWGEKYQPDAITEAGAYPLVWDMWVTDDGRIDTESGCTRTGGEALTEMMADAHYGPHTGLAQLVYLSEPTTFFDPVSGEAAPYPGGNAIYVLASQSVRQLWTPDTTDGVNPLDTEVDRAVDELSSYAADNNGGVGEPAVRVPGEELGRSSDFQKQCEEPTGGFTSALSFTHDCSTGCSADTVATVYTFEVNSTDGALGGGGTIPAFGTQHVDRYEFGTGQHAWIDVDPFDGDPARNTDTSSAPPTGD